MNNTKCMVYFMISELPVDQELGFVVIFLVSSIVDQLIRFYLDVRLMKSLRENSNPETKRRVAR